MLSIYNYFGFLKTIFNITIFYILLDGFPSMQRHHWIPTQDHHSTLSRPRSSEFIPNGTNGTILNGRTLNGVVARGPGGLHEDLEFPPTPRTLSKKKNIVWLRPHVS